CLNGSNLFFLIFLQKKSTDARDPELLAQHNITHILSIHDTAAPVLETYLCISAADHSKQNLTQYFRDSIMFIHESRLKGEGCLVHCVAGVSRSVTLVVAYIMTVTGRGWVEALAAVRSARPCAGPNLGFLRQLEEFENTELREVRAASSLTLASSNIMEIMENTLKVLGRSPVNTLE
uniref:Dual specificity phosphatase 22 n=1 Tax=Salarias fasciatus TaxID=181472 RepID=A0A672FFN5_SALFA